MTTTIKLRGDTAADWTAEDPVLSAREPGLETDTDRWKWGDGVTAWNALPYVANPDGSGGGGGGYPPALVACKALRTAVQVGTNNADVVVDFTAADEFDTNAMHDPAGANPSRITVPTTGLYRATGKVQWAAAANANGTRLGALRQNGAAYPFGHTGVRTTHGSTSTMYLTFSDDVPLTAGDYLQLVTNQDHGANLNIMFASLSVVLLGTV